MFHYQCESFFSFFSFFFSSSSSSFFSVSRFDSIINLNITVLNDVSLSLLQVAWERVQCQPKVNFLSFLLLLLLPSHWIESMSKMLKKFEQHNFHKFGKVSFFIFIFQYYSQIIAYYFKMKYFSFLYFNIRFLFDCRT